MLETDTYVHHLGSQKCKENGGILVEPRTAEENAFVNGLNATTSFILGLTDKDQENTFVWDSDGTPANYTNFGPDQPSWMWKHHDCVLMWRPLGADEHKNDEWADYDCNAKNIRIARPLKIKHLVCERTIGLWGLSFLLVLHLRSAKPMVPKHFPADPCDDFSLIFVPPPPPIKKLTTKVK